uniref:Uncharacterized protein n=1 Tax=Mesocestoides corti TaxID=53468 RepID=A0A5K3G3Q6_MESCO
MWFAHEVSTPDHLGVTFYAKPVRITVPHFITWSIFWSSRSRCTLFVVSRWRARRCCAPTRRSSHAGRRCSATPTTPTPKPSASVCGRCVSTSRSRSTRQTRSVASRWSRQSSHPLNASAARLGKSALVMWAGRGRSEPTSMLSGTDSLYAWMNYSKKRLVCSGHCRSAQEFLA